MFLLTTNFLNETDIYVKIFYIFLKTVLNQTWNTFNAKFSL